MMAKTQPPPVHHQNGGAAKKSSNCGGKTGTATAGVVAGNPFPAMSLDEIQPEMIAYGPHGEPPITLDHRVNAKTMIQTLKDAQLFEYSRVVFITHGFWGNSRSKWIHDLKDKFMAESEQTFVIVGWGKGAELAAYKYAQAASNAEPVARWLAPYILEMKRKIGNKIKIWGIGEGIGAHVMGLAGRISHAFTRITALDPAGPAYELVNEDAMLCATDCPFVDVIHTDSYHEFRSSESYSLINKYGTLRPCGTLDFYVNFGYDQPNAADFTNAGAHLRAIELFAWSIENPGELRTQFVLNGTPGIDKPVTKTKRVVQPAEMGYHADCKATGNYYLETNSEEPWKEGF